MFSTSFDNLLHLIFLLNLIHTAPQTWYSLWFKHFYCQPRAAKGFSVYLHSDLNIAGLSERRLKCDRAAHLCSLWLGPGEGHGCTILSLAPEGRNGSAGTPLCQRYCYLSTGPVGATADPCTRAGKQQRQRREELLERQPHRKTRNNNCFYSSHEGQINTFLSRQIKMNNGGRASAVYSARYMENGMQFGRVVTWNGTNERLSAAVTFCGRWRDVRPLLICSVIPQQSSESELVRVLFCSPAEGPSFSSTIKTKKSQTDVCTWRSWRAAVSDFIEATIWISSVIHLDNLHAKMCRCMCFYPCKTQFLSPSSVNQSHYINIPCRWSHGLRGTQDGSA